MRIAYRSGQTWVFHTLALIVSIGVFLFYSFAHGIHSDPVAGFFNPRFLVNEHGSYLVWLLLFGVIWLCSDFHARNSRECIAEAIDSRPISNTQFILGQVIGIFLVTSILSISVVALLQVIGSTLYLTDFWMGHALEPVSMLAFIVLNVLPPLFLWSSIGALLSYVLRSRTAAMIVGFALLALQMWMTTSVPLYLLEGISLVGTGEGLASDLSPHFAHGRTTLHRASIVVLGIGMAFVASLAYRRLDTVAYSDGKRAAGIALVVLGCGGMGLVTTGGNHELHLREQWENSHRRALSEYKSLIPDILTITGRVKIDPGKELITNVQIAVSAPSGAHLDRLFLSLNPGMNISRLVVDGAETTAFQHIDGILFVTLTKPISPESRTIVALEAVGIPDSRFGYLDSAIDWRQRTLGSRLRLLGTEAAIFEDDYVALTPAVNWLPFAGPNLTRGESRKRDYFQIDLSVEVPDGWIAVAPGRVPQPAGSSEHRFRATIASDGLGLLASRYHQIFTDVGGIHVELLLSKEHLRNLKFWSGIGEAVTERLSRIFLELEAYGLPYRGAQLTMAEVPSRLRTYSGGWRMESVQSWPGVLLLKEHSLPTARFEYRYENADFGHLSNDEIADQIVSQLSMFFLRDFGGGDAFSGLGKNLMSTVGVYGRGASAVEFICRDLATRLLTGFRGRVYSFSAHAFDTEAHFGTAIWQMLSVNRAGNLQSIIWPTYLDSDRPSIWLAAGKTSLGDVESIDDSRTAAGVLALRGDAAARAIFDQLGRYGVGSLLGKFRKRYDGRSVAVEEFVEFMREIDVKAGNILDLALSQGGLPGYLASPVKVIRLRDDKEVGKSRYHLNVHVRNDERSTGIFRVGESILDTRLSSDLHILPGDASLEIGMVTEDIPDTLFLFPYLSLNRSPLVLSILSHAELLDGEASPLAVGARTSDWQPPSMDGVVVDDLDREFMIDWDKGYGYSRGLSDIYRGWIIEMDSALPEFERVSGEWVRSSVPTAWGKYRRTVALARHGQGHRKAVFSVLLPEVGKWQLDLHMPKSYAMDQGPAFGGLGTMHLSVEFGSQIGTVEFDAAFAEEGWNKVGEFVISSSEVRVVISNRTDGEVVVVDAIRLVAL